MSSFCITPAESGEMKHTKERLEVAVAASTNYSEVCRYLGVKPMTGAQSHIKSRIVLFGINTNHFTGSGWRKRLPIEERAPFPRKPASVYLIRGSSVHPSKLLKKLLAEGIRLRKCEHCDGIEWQGLPIPLELHHIDTDHFNNLPENLAILCPNCHTLCHHNKQNMEPAVGFEPTTH